MFKIIYKFAPRNRTPTKHSTCSRPLKYVNKVKHHGSLLYKTHQNTPIHTYNKATYKNTAKYINCIFC